MFFRILHDQSSDELTYLLADAHAREAVLIDPHARDLPVLLALLDEQRLRLRWVLRTHEHDTLNPGEQERLARLGAPLLQGRAGSCAEPVAEGAQLAFGSERLRVLNTPGHTPDCLSFVWRDRVFCGGLLAVDACHHQPHPADPAALWDSVTQRIFPLPDETLLFAGQVQHRRLVSSVFEQRRWHPHFSGASRDAFLASMAGLTAPATRPAFFHQPEPLTP